VGGSARSSLRATTGTAAATRKWNLRRCRTGRAASKMPGLPSAAAPDGSKTFRTVGTLGRIGAVGLSMVAATRPFRHGAKVVVEWRLECT
jgi:hypothetical protein